MAYIRINRKLFSNQLWKENRVFSRAEAWIDLIQLMSFTFKNKRIIDGVKVEWSRGQYPISYSFLADRWRWSVHKTRAFLKLLLDEKQITLDFTGRTTIITLCNYEYYNPISQGEGMSGGTPSGIVTAQQTAQQTAQITDNETDEYSDNSQGEGISDGTANGKEEAGTIITYKKKNDKEDREEKEKYKKEKNPNPEERDNKNDKPIEPIDPEMQKWIELTKGYNEDEIKRHPDYPHHRKHWTWEEVKADWEEGEKRAQELYEWDMADQKRKAEIKNLDLPNFDEWERQEKAKSKKKSKVQDDEEIL